MQTNTLVKLQAINKMALDISWCASRLGEHARLFSDQFDNFDTKDAVLAQVCFHVGLDHLDAWYFQQMRVKELSAREYRVAIDEVFFFLTKWHEEAAKPKKSSVVDDSNQITATQDRDEPI